MHDRERLTNLVGASSLAIADLMLGSVAESAGTGRSGGAALTVLWHADGLSVTDLGRRVGLSQPAAARMVDGLVKERLVRRSSGTGREVRVVLTPLGRRRARRALDGRAERLTSLVHGLSVREQRTLSTLLEKLLANVYGHIPSSDRICCLCDRAACVSAGNRCPVAEAAESPNA